MCLISGCMFYLRGYFSLQLNRACAGSPTCTRCRGTAEDRGCRTHYFRSVGMSELAGHVVFRQTVIQNIHFTLKFERPCKCQLYSHSQECSRFSIFIRQLVCVRNPMAVVTLCVDFEVRLLMLSCRGPISPWSAYTAVCICVSEILEETISSENTNIKSALTVMTSSRRKKGHIKDTKCISKPFWFS